MSETYIKWLNKGTSFEEKKVKKILKFISGAQSPISLANDTHSFLLWQKLRLLYKDLWIETSFTE